MNQQAAVDGVTGDARTTGAPGSGDRPSVTGDAAVDAALSRLTSLPGTPVRDHVAVFEAVHAALQDRLADPED